MNHAKYPFITVTEEVRCINRDESYCYVGFEPKTVWIPIHQKVVFAPDVAISVKEKTVENAIKFMLKSLKLLRDELNTLELE